MNSLFLFVFMGLGIIYLVLGLIFSRGIKTTEDYFLAGRKLGLFPLTFTLIGTQLGGGMLLGTAAESYKFGYWGLAYVFGICLGFLFLGMGIASKLRSFNIATTAELFEKKYNSIFLRKIASILSVATLFGILCAQIVALRSLLLGIGIDSTWVLFVFWVVLVFRTVWGGVKAVAIADSAQVLFLTIVFLGVFLFSLLNEPASFFNVKDFFLRQDFFYTANLSFATLFSITFNTALFSLIEQDLAQKFFSAKTRRTATLAAIFSALFILAFALIPIYFGMKAKINGMSFLVGANPLFAILGSVLNNFFMILVVCAVSAAITSTADSLLCAISSNLSQDFDFSFFGFKEKLKNSKTITFLVGFLALFVAYLANDIIGVLIQSYELSVSCLFIPTFFCYLTDNLKKKAAFFSIICGGIGFMIFRFFVLPFPKEIATLMLSLLGYVIGIYSEKKDGISRV